MGADTDRRSRDDYPDDGVGYLADQGKLQTFTDASLSLSRTKSPVLRHDGNPHEKLFVACFDGTGNDKNKDPIHTTNVAKIDSQIRELNKTSDVPINSGYVPGPGTQDKFLPRTIDGITGHTYDQRTEQMYKLFIEQAKQWRNEDPNAEIRIAEIGFSRGADQIPGFARLVEERGIQDPAGAKYTRNSDGQITHVEYTKAPLVAPGQTAQAVGMFDPVGTGDAIRNHDRRLPPSVISGFQIAAEDEHRGLFKSDRIIKPGESVDGRFLSVNVAGAHSDVGGGYLRNGLAIRSENIMIDYLNSLSDTAFLHKDIIPTDPSLNVVHRSEKGSLLYKFYPKIDRSKPDGYNDLLVPKSQIGNVGDAYHAEPRNEWLSQQFERQQVEIGDLPRLAQARDVPPGTLSSQLNGLLAAGSSGDQAAMRAGTQAFANSEAARTMQSSAVAAVNRQEQAAVAPQNLAQQPAQQGPASPQLNASGPQR
jgi:hypothetical protein